MYAIEFEADIENNLLRIPENYKNLNKVHARVIILTQEPQYPTTTFNPRAFFGIGKQSKQVCDAYLANVRDGWN
ncbi:hypothetical protein [Crenothrix sp.]|uniref:hypothetical protein n=1 Tax=Crenothrix sp. TaxID=3100433 RepID=UPI00374CE5CA